MNKKVNVNDQLSRMKGLMNYGLKTESKNSTYSSVEYQKLGADGNVYGIIREGAKYYIEKAANKKNLVKEDFNYIGGFKNRKDYEYSSFASAQKNFDLKMMSLREAYANGKNIVIESWNPDKKESLTVEATDKMRNEILRERQIMNNAARINESKPQVMFTEDDKTCGVCGSKECKCEDPAKSADIEGYENLKDAKPKKSFRQSKHSTGKAKEANDYKPVKESAEVLGWHQTGQDAKGNMADTYMDKTHGTEVGDSAPFDEEPVEEGTSMHSEGENQNNPTVGSNKIGDGAPFDKSGKVNEDVDDDMSDEDETYFEPKEDLEEPVDDDTELDKPEEGLEDSPEDEGDDEEEFGSDLDDDDSDDDDEFENDEDEFDEDDKLATESRRNRGYKIYESRAFRKAKRAMNEDGMKPFSNKNRVPQNALNALDEFGKHPAYRKQPMTVPTHNHQEFDGYYDMSDESARNNTPFGTNIGNGAPFELDTEKVNKSIAESIRRNLRMLKKKSNRK